MRMFIVLFLSFTSGCFAQGNVIFNEDFQQGIPVAFTMFDLGQNTPNLQVAEFTQPWISVTDPENPMDTVAASTSFFTTADTANHWLITPSISLGAFGNYLTWNAKSQDASYLDGYYVLISTTDAQTASFVDTLFFVSAENFEWESREVNLTQKGFDNQNVFIAFVLRTFDGFKLYVDDIQVRSLDNTSVIEQAPIKVTLFPNPTSDFVHVSQMPVNTPYDVLDLTGNLIFSGDSNQFDVTSWAAGTYIIRFANATLSPLKFVKN